MKKDSRILICVMLLAVLVASRRVEGLAGDPGIYRSRMAFLFSGEVPYVDFFFEHPPLAIVPMALTWLLGGAYDPFVYSVLFALLMATCLLLTLRGVERVASQMGVSDAGLRWLALAGFMFPIVLFRYDPVPVLMAVLALAGFIEGRGRIGAWWAASGILTKGWPAAFALTEWWRGRRAEALGLAGLSIAIFGFLLTLPGFLQARSFGGIHSETLLGGVFTLVRIRSGSSLELITDAGATYVAVPTWAVVVNVAAGLAVLGLALSRGKGEFSWPKGVRLLAAAIVAILIGSPLLSPQFLLWPTPFLALHANPWVRRLTMAASGLTLLYMLGWNPGFNGDLWWVGVMNLRNVVLLTLGFAAALTITDRRQAAVARA